MSDEAGADEPRRVMVYVDGFNLYYGIMDKGWGRYRWLDVQALIAAFIRPPQTLVTVHFYGWRSLSAERFAFTVARNRPNF